MTIRNLTRNKAVADRADRADNPWKRMKGLLGRSQLAPGEALLISPCQSVHMLFMKFVIDVIFLDKQNRVVGLCGGLKPFQFSPVFWKSACAIEAPVGTIVKTHTQLGDQFQLTGNDRSGRHV